MNTNKNIINEYKIPKFIKPKHVDNSKIPITQILIFFVIFSILPTFVIELYFKRSFMQLVIRILIALISHWSITFIIIFKSLKVRVSSNNTSSIDGLIFVAFIAGFIPQILYALFLFINQNRINL